MKRGKFVIVSGPSGVGKSTAMKVIRQEKPEWKYPLSVKTRAPRPGEKNGMADLFITREEFEAKISGGEFLEWAEYGGNYYGTLLSDIQNGIKQGVVMIKEMEVQGYEIVTQKMDMADYAGVFIMPDGDPTSLIHRITQRASLSDTELQERVAAMKKEIAVGQQYAEKVISHEGEIERMVRDVQEAIERAAQRNDEQ